MKKFINITFKFSKCFGIFVLFVFLSCSDSEYWKYFIRGSLLTSIKESRTELSLNYAPRSAYCFDKDLDGDQDLFVITDDDLIFVYENLVGGRLSTPPPAYIVENVPQRMAVADFNDDKYLDMVVTNQLSHDFAFLTNSSGHFPNMVYQDAGEEPFAVYSDDLNKDGKPDLLVSNLAENSLYIYQNINGQEFELKKIKPVGEMPFGLVTLDIDKNGFPDIFSVNFESNDVSVIRNAGDFYFHDEEIYPVRGNPSDIVSIDFNGDRNYDVAITQFEIDSLTILLNNGKGEFDQMLQFPTGVSPVSLLSIDIDFNGWEDLILANADEDSLSFFMNGPEFLDQFKYEVAPGFNASHLNVGLINQNQYYDLILSSFNDKKVLILFDVVAPQAF